ncbi:hypothetical protein [Maribellus maritimus]|uniref:hypothetical protein n=1 Tax=Maribellus maritimus TaxID=2870838 RepID=UPI001EEA9950|nr:hypothetical protein [Maribellus maritimus]MCG6189119.1 hypothetical protein [Maribellus maritimus]
MFEKKRIPKLPKEVVDSKLKEIGEKVKEKRSMAVDGKNYINFAKVHHINYYTLARIENGEDFKMSSFLEVLNALGITPEEFFTGIK